MENLIKIFAQIELYAGVNMRQSSFSNGYKPLFSFGGLNTKVSGKIELTNASQFAPGTKGSVYVYFNKSVFENFKLITGQTFTFSEGVNDLGKGTVLEVFS